MRRVQSSQPYQTIQQAVQALKAAGFAERYALFFVSHGTLSLLAAPKTRLGEQRRLEQAVRCVHRGEPVRGISVQILGSTKQPIGYIATFNAAAIAPDLEARITSMLMMRAERDVARVKQADVDAGQVLSGLHALEREDRKNEVFPDATRSVYAHQPVYRTATPARGARRGIADDFEDLRR